MSAVAPTTTDQVLAAAQAALALLPIPAGAVVEAAVPADLPAAWHGVVRRFTGARGGSAGLLLDPVAAASLSTALAQTSPADPPAAVDPADAVGPGFLAACVPALDAVSQALGPVAVLDAVATTGGSLTDRLSEAGDAAAVAVIMVDSQPQAYVVLLFDPSGPSGAGAALPGPRPAQDIRDPAAAARGMDLLRSVPMEVTAEIGRTRMTISELLSLSPGAVVELDRPVGSPADVLVNGRLFARGEVVVVDEDFAIRITEIVDAAADPGTGVTGR